MAMSKRNLFLKRRMRNRSKMRKVAAGRPRLSVHRSNKNISVQLIDDVNGKTLASASTMSTKIEGHSGNIEAATQVGEALAKKALEAGINKTVVDRNGYLFHGRVKALAFAAKNNGLKF